MISTFQHYCNIQQNINILTKILKLTNVAGDPPKPPPRPKRRNKMKVKNLQVISSHFSPLYLTTLSLMMLRNSKIVTLIIGTNDKVM